MLKSISISEIRNILEACGVKTRNIRKEVTIAIYDGRLKQKHRFSTIITPGNVTLEDFLKSILIQNKRSWDDVNRAKLTSNENEIVSKIV